MPNYDFRYLSPLDFEDLCRDLLQSELEITLQSFTSGRDQGIDLRHSRGGDNSIVQCKHYCSSSFSQLLGHLKNSELEKVKKLNPSRYILMTSLGLTPQNKEKILDLLTPYLQSADDIYGNTDVNNLLGKFENIEKKHFKLWLTSIPILEKVLHSKLYNQSQFEVEKIHEKTKLYVQNNSFPEALEILKNHKTCIISGIPGIGKTTLAEMLIVHFLSQDYEVIKITSDISEAFQLYKTENKQVFYYDDFLGQTTLKDKFNKNEDKGLLDFIQGLSRTKNKHLILTTREYILNQARLIYGNFANASLDCTKCIVDLSKYTRLIKARILYNHLFFSGLVPHLVQEVISDKNYLKIIDHKNYSPRIIEWMTANRASSILPGGYFNNFITILDNPEKLWEHSFKQLSVPSRHLLLILATLPPKTVLEDTEAAFWHFYKFCSKELNFSIDAQDFFLALKELDGTFIKSEKSLNKIFVNFHNPSVRDFLENHISDNDLAINQLCNSCIFFSQGVWLWGNRYSDINGSQKRKNIIKKISSYFWRGIERTRSNGNPNFNSGPESPFGEYFYTKEKQILFTLYLSKVLPDLCSETVISTQFSDFLEGLEDDEGNKEEILNLLEELEELQFSTGYGTSIDEVIQKVKPFLSREIECIDDLHYLEEFYQKYSDSFTEENRQEVRELFEENCEKIARNILENTDDSSDEIHIKTNYFRSFLETFQIEEEAFEEYVSAMDEIFRERLSYEESQAEGDYDSWKEGRREAEYSQRSEEQLIDSMFDSLRTD